MRSSSFLILALSFALPSLAQDDAARGGQGGGHGPKLVDSQKLQDAVTVEALLEHANTLQGFAYAYPERNRQFGGKAHNDTVNYLYKSLTAKKLKGYYKVTKQSFVEPTFHPGNFTFTQDGEPVPDSIQFAYTPNGAAEAPLVPVANVGCSASDYPAELAGNIALISRGSCDFGLKVAFAGSVGAVGAVIYNNVDGILPPGATLVAPPRPEGPYVPAIGVLNSQGVAWRTAIEGGEEVVVAISVEGGSVVELWTQNVIAETAGGDHQNVLQLGAHTDSVAAGPGINDNGSGTIALLEIALQLAKYKVNNAVRFSWWSAEEDGLLGSEFYVASLSEDELAKIRLYLNFDMISSPNYVLAAYDGDGSTFGTVGPAGSAEAEKLFHDYYDSVGSPSTSSEFNGRSDYGPFLDAGIACGGLDTGAEGIKTAEEAATFGGTAGIAYDPCYHSACDTVDNLALPALEINSKAIAHAVATYGASFDSLPPKAASFAAQKAASPKYKFDAKGGVFVA
ncbi:hypothetical protein DL96DRAFT_1582517 [Flagelloscypha sp. PMI_526]|nr:hypothetical protein DL96DRAFT_1582517 [Flagelloscypha sp. PMI_526]